MAESENQETQKDEIYSNDQSSEKNCHLKMKEGDDNDELSHSDRDTGIDPEKRKRRSSILKQKLGNQSDNLVESVSCKASRRVSFASSNFVKPFAADPEKNTIWDNTYEEEVNHTDSTKSSEGTHASGRMNMTSFQIWESNSVQYAIPESIDQSEKENTVPIVRAACSNETNLKITEMEFTGTYGMNLVQYVKSQQVASSLHDDSLLDMSLTCGFPKDIAQVNKTFHAIDNMDTFEVNNQEVEMELTTIGNAEIIMNTHKVTDITRFRHNLNETLQPIDMELTSDLTGVVNNQRTFLIHQDVENSPMDMEDTTLQAVVENCSESMEITCHQNDVAEDVEQVEKKLKSTENVEICIERQKPNIGNDFEEPVNSNKENFANLKGDQGLQSIPKIKITCNEHFPESITHNPVVTHEVFSDDNILQNLSTDDSSKIQCNISIGKTYTEMPTEDTNQNGKTRNILYSQPIKSILKSSDISCNLVTPTMSFTMSPSNMSPCAETTQQLIQATFSKPESINILLKGKNVANQITGDSDANKLDSDETLAEPIFVHEGSNEIGIPIIVYQDANEIAKPVIVYEDPMPGSSAQHEIGGWDLIQHSKSICDITPMIDDEEISLVDNEGPGKSGSSVASTNKIKLGPAGNICLDSSAKSSNDEKSPKSIRREQRRAMIAKLKASIKIACNHTEAEKICDMLCKEHKELNKDLKEIIEKTRFPIFEVADVEELRDASEESSSSQLSEGALNDSECQKRLSIPDIVVPMSLLERVCEAARRCEKYWQYEKSNESYYVFYGCFRAVPFKVHVQPESGKVLGLETFNNLLDESSALTHYEAEIFKMKLKQEYLLAHLGSNFDLLTLLDYVCICTEEIEKFHLEFHELIVKYGFSHKLKMHRDNRASFEILHVKYIICWKISVTFSTTNLGHVESVCATYELQEKVDEDEIKKIAENCVMGLQFLRCFIEKVDEYVKKMGRRIMAKREAIYREHFIQ